MSEPALQSSVDPMRCPLCGASNQCVMAGSPGAGDPTLPCWCTRATIDRAQLARIPDAARHKACLCPACAAASPAEPGVASQGGQPAR
jgi:hypothetical protein